MNIFKYFSTVVRRIGRGALAGLAIASLAGVSTVCAPAADTPAKAPAARTVPPDDGKLRIISFGAHPDDCELQASGVGAMWARKGHHVKFVSVTNGDIGHWREAGGPLALRRKREVEQADGILGVHSEVLDIHDGELEPTLENRKKSRGSSANGRRTS